MSYDPSAPAGLSPLPSPEELAHELLPFPVPSIVERSLGHTLGLNELYELSRSLPPSEAPEDLASQALAALGIRVRIEAASVPQDGPLIFVSNHPFGLLEGLVLLAKLVAFRPDIRILANSLLSSIRGLSKRFIPIDPFETHGAQQRNMRGLREALLHLRQQGAVVVFPAGTVSHWRKGCGISDPDWHDTALRLCRKTDATIVPIYFEGRNSLGFSLAGLLHPGLRTLLLPRELLRKRNTTVSLRLGTPIRREVLECLPSPRIQTEYLRMRCYALRERNTAEHSAVRQQPIAPPQPPETVERALNELPASALLLSEGCYRLYLMHGDSSPRLLEELGRTREMTFREAGEGTGNRIDLDRFDSTYHHLLLWNEEGREIAGAYRLGLVPDLLRHNGLEGVYSATLFRFDPVFFERYGQSLELGRALVHPSYQKDFLPLLLLWKGIARFVLSHPAIRYLFGPVSLNLDAAPATLRIITAYLAGQHGSPELERIIRGRAPVSGSAKDVPGEAFIRSVREGLLDYKSLDRLVRSQEQGRGIPILFKHYLKLGGRIAAFHQDRSFNSLDAFLFVDLPRAPESMLQRYMGREETSGYRARHAGCVG